MIAKGTAAALGIAALLGGCAQSPASYYQPVPPYADPAAPAPSWSLAPLIASPPVEPPPSPPPAPEWSPMPRAYAEPPPPVPAPSPIAPAPAAPTPPAVATWSPPEPAPAHAEDPGACVGWWRICHF